MQRLTLCVHLIKHVYQNSVELDVSKQIMQNIIMSYENNIFQDHFMRAKMTKTFKRHVFWFQRSFYGVDYSSLDLHHGFWIGRVEAPILQEGEYETHTYIYTCIHAYIYIHTHTCIYIHTHIQQAYLIKHVYLSSIDLDASIT